MAGAFGVFPDEPLGTNRRDGHRTRPGDSQPISFGLRAAKGEAAVAGNPPRAIQAALPGVDVFA
jgi:hypothetical protein